MIALTATQQVILSAARQKTSWLFIVTTGDGLTTYYWSTKTRSFGGDNYTYAVLPDSFRGVTMNRARSELGIQGPTDLSFSVGNPGDALDPADFVDGTVILRQVQGDYAGNEEILRGWKFRIRTASNVYQILTLTCVDFLQDILAGNYPNRPLVKDIFLSKNTDQDASICAPLPFGTAYVPLRPVYTGGEMFYLIGPDSGAYTLTELRSPRSQGAKSIWSSADYEFTPAVKTDALARDWKVFSPKIAYSRQGLSAPDVTGFWRTGEQFLDVPVQYFWSVTELLTDPGDVIEYVLTDGTEGMGLASADWDAAAHAAASAIYAGWGLTWTGALWQLEERENVMARLLRMCHSTLDIGETVSLRALSKASQATITSGVVIKEKGKARGTFAMTAASRRQQPDGQYVSWQEANEAQDQFIRTLVPVVDGATPSHPSNTTMECPWVHDSQHVQKLAILDAQRQFLPAGEVSFRAKPGIAGVYCAALQPDDVITINGSNYGGVYTALIDSMTINRSGIIEFRCNLLD